MEQPTYHEVMSDSELVMKFALDMAQGIFGLGVLAVRYGFVNRVVMLRFIQDNPYVQRLIQQYKAAYESDDAVERRVRLKAGLSVEALIPHIANLAGMKETPIGQRIECFHKLMRAAGTDGAPAQPSRFSGDGGSGGTTFTLNFIWSDGRKETVLTGTQPPPVIEHEDVA
jgi:hypothetical protein